MDPSVLATVPEGLREVVEENFITALLKAEQEHRENFARRRRTYEQQAADHQTQHDADATRAREEVEGQRTQAQEEGSRSRDNPSTENPVQRCMTRAMSGRVEQQRRLQAVQLTAGIQNREKEATSGEQEEQEEKGIKVVDDEEQEEKEEEQPASMTHHAEKEQHEEDEALILM